MKLRENFDNIWQIYGQKKYFTISLVASFVIGFVLFYFTDYPLIAGNMGELHANLQVVVQLILSWLFGLNISLLWYKLEISAFIRAKTVGSTLIGSLISILVSGCAACSVTLASYIGLASIVSALPFYGLELKLAGTLLLMYSIISISKNINTCKR